MSPQLCSPTACCWWSGVCVSAGVATTPGGEPDVHADLQLDVVGGQLRGPSDSDPAAER